MTETPLGAIGDTVFFDIDSNGVQGPGEGGVAADVVLLRVDSTGGFSLAGRQTTNATGGYLFTGLEAGSYTVAVSPENNLFVPTADPDSELDRSHSLTLAEGEVNLDVDFGFNCKSFVPVLLVCTHNVAVAGIIGDKVFLDENGNGAQDMSDSGIPGVAVMLISGGMTVAETTTNDLGFYSFPDLFAGAYTVQITVPENLEPVFEFDVVLDGMTSIELGPGESRLDIDFGLDGKFGQMDQMYSWCSRASHH